MPPNKYRSLTHPLVYLLIFLIPLSLYILALVIALIALLLGAFTLFSRDNYLMNGLLVVADSLVEAGNKVLAGSMCLNDNNQDQQLQSSLDASGITNQPSISIQPDNRQNQYPMMVPINQYNNTAYQHQQSRLQQRVDSPSSTVDYPKSGFTYEELLVATDRFSAQNFLGKGGFGFVHRGILSDGRVVAIKQLKSDNTWGQREFKAELDVLSRVHHRHLVQYFGCCIAQDKRMIACEYMPNKTVDYHLHGQHGRTLNWHNRLKISIGAAKGLSYLHEECQPRIIHRDIKAANILLDPSFEAKVADFGLAKIFPDDVSQIVATNLMGTCGYLAPELFGGEIREKSDTYAFGVVLLELITGKKPIITLPAFSEESNPFETLANWARPLLRESLQNGSYDSLLDSQLCNVYNSDEMKRMIACAAACVQISPHGRPSMSKVALVLAGQASPDDLYIGVESTEIPTAPTSSTYFEESMSRTN